MFDLFADRPLGRIRILLQLSSKGIVHPESDVVPLSYGRRL